MRYRKGDTITIKPLDQVKQTLDRSYHKTVQLYWNQGSMDELCGNSYKVLRLETSNMGTLIYVIQARHNIHEWSIDHEWVEPLFNISVDDEMFTL